MNHRLGLVQVQSAYGANVYLPYAVGLLWAYARTFPEIRDDWQEPIFLYKKEQISKALAKLGDPLPELVAFSTYIWNAEWNYALARAIKEKSPDTAIVYGGVHIPDVPDGQWFSEHDEVDFCLHGEGEGSFVALLREYANGRNWDNVPGLSFAGFQTKREFPAIDRLRSPYLDGVFDEIWKQESRWQVLQETNRGCAFACTFCCWGASALNRIRPFPMERVVEEIDWFGRHKIDYIDNADANFAVLERDEEIAEVVAKTKEKYGYPEKFRTSFAKYTNDRIAERVFRIAKRLNGTGQLKAVTLALQSTDEHVLTEIKRKNIAMDNFATLQNRYKSEGIPTYTELILGLPGETYDSFVAGLEKVLSSGQEEGLFVYLCTKLPNSEMADPAYVKKHVIETVRMRAMLSHGTPTPDTPDEWQDTVIATNTMPFEDWNRAYMLSWIIQVCHCMGLTRWWAKRDKVKGDVLSLVKFYKWLIWEVEENTGDGSTVLSRAYFHTKRLLQRAIEGGSWDNVLPGFGDISWPPDEGGFLMIASELDKFYDEMETYGMPAEQRQHGPPPIPEGKEEAYAKQVWYGRKGNFLEGLRKVVAE